MSNIVLKVPVLCFQVCSRLIDNPFALTLKSCVDGYIVAIPNCHGAEERVDAGRTPSIGE